MEMTHAVDDLRKTCINAKKRKVKILTTTVVILAAMTDIPETTVVMMFQEKIPSLVICILSWVIQCYNGTEVLI